MTMRTHSMIEQAVAALEYLLNEGSAELDMITRFSVQQTTRMLQQDLKEVEDGQR